ncbi:DUF4126 domain-containing protein [Brachybacterium sp. JHP9]|uniref:DUF4126 domain-containing protein n=1 Tax=Brachybacterium equifaecis TaxID=2910770 RepID=A0ABT0QZI6_9MICO|nr:DUF4126 domain-containing protein [Brachybacterium equifaecis]MCL6423067.1 DUF4126 domain-containing protein [Brachybacterium equifaecis]
MEALMMTLGSGWVSGVRPYFMLFLLGLSGRLFDIEQIPTVLQRTDVLVIAGILLVVDFAADKIAFLDSFWDAVHTFVRPLAGGAIGYLLGGETDTTTAIVMAVLGMMTSLGAHATKSAARAVVNVSPEPVSNVIVSGAEDVAAVVVGGLAIVLPAVAGVLALILLVIGGFLIYRAIRLVRRMRARRAARGGDGSHAVISGELR